MVLQGLRGVGKTVLLREFQRQVFDHDWITAIVEAGATPGSTPAGGNEQHPNNVTTYEPWPATRTDPANPAKSPDD